VLFCFFFCFQCNRFPGMTDDMSLSYADVISMVRDVVLAFINSHFSTADACSLIECLCTV